MACVLKRNRLVLAFLACKLLLVALPCIRFCPLVVLRLSLLCSSALLTRVCFPLCAQVSAMLTMKVNGTEMLVTGGPNGTLGIFDLTVLKQVGEAHGHTAPVRTHPPRARSLGIMRSLIDGLMAVGDFRWRHCWPDHRTRMSSSLRARTGALHLGLPRLPWCAAGSWLRFCRQDNTSVEVGLSSTVTRREE